MLGKQKIVLVSSGVLPVPCPGYGGLEMVVADLAETLANGGHNVFVVAPTGSTIADKHPNISLMDCGPVNPNAPEWEQQAFTKYRPMMDSVDFNGAIWHDHSWRKFTYLAKMQNPNLHVMSTLHGMLPYQKSPPVNKPCMAGISKSHADEVSAGLGIPIRFVYNGINLDNYKFAPKEGRNDRFLFLARMTAFKGAHVFIDAIKQIGAKGDLVGDDQMVEDQEYVMRLMKGCGEYPNVKYWGGVSRERASEFFKTAKAYVLPCSPNWREPFGLTVIEAMASGCPVVATPSGAIPELLVNGETGYLSPSLQDISSFLTDEKINAIDPQKCRERAEQFSRDKMCEGYEKLYEECLSGGW